MARLEEATNRNVARLDGRIGREEEEKKEESEEDDWETADQASDRFEPHNVLQLKKYFVSYSTDPLVNRSIVYFFIVRSAFILQIMRNQLNSIPRLITTVHGSAMTTSSILS